MARATKPELNANALLVLEKRYLAQTPRGRETPAQLFERVALAIAARESGSAKSLWAARFNQLMSSRRFMPNSPTLMNAGKKGGQLSACFVLPIEDSLDGIFDTLKAAAKIHQSGGGTGFSFSRLRPRGSPVKSSLGVASGPVSFMGVYDTATEAIKQGGARRGANMGILRADHPDIFEFIDCKNDFKSVINFNISVGATREFMDALKGGGDYPLRNPSTGKEVRRVRAAEVFDRLVQSAWKSGDPGLVFLDRINVFNPTPALGEMESTNPCGEQPLLAWESCNLGSLNVSRYFRKGAIDWASLREDIHTAVRFLDNVIDLNAYPVAECRKITLRNRKVGLGVMGFADLLLKMAIPYTSGEAVFLGEKIMSFVDREAKRASALLAHSRGAFPNFKKSLWHRLGYPALRNATVSTVAPTGTISIIAGASSGIEPIFSGIYYRNVLSGERLMDVHEAVQEALVAHGRNPAGISEAEIEQALGAAWTPAPRVSIEQHVRMQAAFQRHSDSAVSKTINLPESATPDDIAEAYRLAYDLGCKGITVYRDRSRPAQVLVRAATCPEC
jgi:ribonucleoside-diphosphate reductase alpha chain